jgi:hypothetical protein
MTLLAIFVQTAHRKEPSVPCARYRQLHWRPSTVRLAIKPISTIEMNGIATVAGKMLAPTRIAAVTAPIPTVRTISNPLTLLEAISAG